MKKYAIALVLSCCYFGAQAEVADSIGTKVKNGTVYILHKVEKGQGLYSISKRYGVSLSELIAENPGSESVIRIDQLIWVPTDREVKLEEPVVEDFFDRTETESDVDTEVEIEEPVKEEEYQTYATYHSVSAGETLFAIAARYHTTVKVIKDLNNLQSDMLAIGQKLLVPAPESSTPEGDKGPANQEDAHTDEAETTNGSRTDYALNVAEETDALEMEVEPMPDDQVEPEQPQISVEGYSIKVTRLEEYDLEQVEETGMYAQAGESIPDNRYWGAHFTAPIGTVILVTNPSNGKNVFVKVVENFKRETESAVILHLSSIAMESIGLEEGQSVQLSYAR